MNVILACRADAVFNVFKIHWIASGFNLLIAMNFCFQTGKALEEKLKASGVPHEVHIYPGASHAFMNKSPEGVQRRKNMGLTDEDDVAVELAWTHFRNWMNRFLSP